VRSPHSARWHSRHAIAGCPRRADPSFDLPCSVNDRPFRGRPVARTNKRLPALPVEIVLYIFQLSVEDSAATACTLARLCTQTRDRVRHALYVQPTLSSVRQINLFLRTVKRAPDLARLVTRLQLDGGLSKRQGDDEHGGRSPLTTRLAKLLELCPALEALELRRVVVFSLTDFANARRASFSIRSLGKEDAY